MADPALVETLSTLSTQLDSLSTSLEPLLKVPYADLIAQQDDPLVKAKLDVLVSYALHDLIWIYLKTSGVEPANHPVMQEIERLKGYFAKLKSAESGHPPAGTPSKVHTTDKRRMQIDKQAASRFINHAIASQKARVDPDYTPGDDSDDAEMGVGGSGTHTRFDADEEAGAATGEGIEKNEEVERLLDDKEDDDEEEGDDQKVEEIRRAVQAEKKKGKGKRVLDPFAGYDQPKAAPSSAEKRKRTSVDADSTSTAASAVSTPLQGLKTAEVSEPNASASKKAKKKKDGKKLKMKK
ncbi:hypothetical protein JCM11491_006998 [Sporobolomyces phaffii]